MTPAEIEEVRTFREELLLMLAGNAAVGVGLLLVFAVGCWMGWL